ncbi:MAG TPA: ParB N-terminal domain-containing protein, partial [Casimicrobiaceae bacterium]|nr:ParB N-terminal domain-containing protein [Casimicrobiaceae bacterium]
MELTLPSGYWGPISELHKWVQNPRINKEAIPAVARSIRKFGFIAPVVVWSSRKRIVAGHTRIAAMELLLAEDPSFVPRDAPGV